jgi:hypothetical protein
MLRIDQDGERRSKAASGVQTLFNLKDLASIYGLFTVSAWANALMASGL